MTTRVLKDKGRVGVYFDPAKVHTLDHKGQFLRRQRSVECVAPHRRDIPW